MLWCQDVLYDRYVVVSGCVCPGGRSGQRRLHPRRGRGPFVPVP